MAIEAKRGCGYRKVGGLYMVGEAGGIPCDRLPIPLEICSCCGQGIKQGRGWQWVDIAGLVGGNHMVPIPPDILYKGGVSESGYGYKATYQECGCLSGACPLCYNVAALGKGGLLWIGQQFYPTIEDFEAEARQLGISRRISTVPRGFEVGKHYVLFAHPRGVAKVINELEAIYVPAIFRVWKPVRIERIYNESQRTSDEVAADIKRGITPVFVPDDDKEHHGSVYAKEEKGNGTAPMFEE